jgi:hypothetical protein
MSERRRKPGQQVAALKEKTVHGLATKSRIRAVVDLVIDELQDRRAKGKSDHVALLADEIEKGGIAAWKSLLDLLPSDDVASGAIGTMAGASLAGIFAGAAAQAAAQARATPTAEIIDVTAEPVPADHVRGETPGDDEPVDW